jgi:hypothetical protein
MAKIIPNPAAGELSGPIGDLVFVRYKPGKVIVRRRPVRASERTAPELANQQSFTASVAYAKNIWATRPDLRAKYEAAAREQGRQGFHLAKADFRHPPKVSDIDLSHYTGNPSETIRITAEDDFEVQTVGVAIRDLSGELIEQGAAVQEDGTWIYRSQARVPAGQTVVIETTAMDYPGHTASKRADHACGPRTS